MHADYCRTDLRPEAEATFERMVRILGEIINGEPPDLVMAAGDSGLSSVALAKLVYECLVRPVPPSVVFPLFRATDSQWRTTGIDITPHIEEARQFRPHHKVHTVLFVDDEIGSGGTFRACMDLLFSMRVCLDLPLRVLVVAEDLSFRPPGLSDADVEFKPFGRREEGISMTSRLIPPEFERQVRRILAPQETQSLFWKRATNVLLDLPVKELTDRGPRWTYRFRDVVASRLPTIHAERAAFSACLDRLARAALARAGHALGLSPGAAVRTLSRS